MDSDDGVAVGLQPDRQVFQSLRFKSAVNEDGLDRGVEVGLGVVIVEESNVRIVGEGRECVAREVVGHAEGGVLIGVVEVDREGLLVFVILRRDLDERVVEGSRVGETEKAGEVAADALLDFIVGGEDDGVVDAGVEKERGEEDGAVKEVAVAVGENDIGRRNCAIKWDGGEGRAGQAEVAGHVVANGGGLVGDGYQALADGGGDLRAALGIGWRGGFRDCGAKRCRVFGPVAEGDVGSQGKAGGVWEMAFARKGRGRDDTGDDGNGAVFVDGLAEVQCVIVETEKASAKDVVVIPAGALAKKLGGLAGEVHLQRILV